VREKKPVFVSPEEAAKEKAAAGENLALEHIAELAPGQARLARAQAIKAEETSLSRVTTVQLNLQLRDLEVECPSKSIKGTLVDCSNRRPNKTQIRGYPIVACPKQMFSQT
jgi:hypothetical protein